MDVNYENIDLLSFLAGVVVDFLDFGFSWLRS